jgi:hypothetical protein
MFKSYLFISIFFFHVALFSQPMGSRSIVAVKDSILKQNHKELIKFTFDNAGSKEYVFIFKERKKWYGIFVFDNSNRSRLTTQPEDIKVKKFNADIIYKKLDSLEIFCLKSISTQDLSETYNAQMQKNKNSKVIYELPNCPMNSLITIEVKKVTMSIVNCWYELAELKTIPEVNRFSKIAPFIIKEAHKFY